MLRLAKRGNRMIGQEGYYALIGQEGCYALTGKRDAMF